MMTTQQLLAEIHACLEEPHLQTPEHVKKVLAELRKRMLTSKASKALKPRVALRVIDAHPGYQVKLSVWKLLEHTYKCCEEFISPITFESRGDAWAWIQSDHMYSGDEKISGQGTFEFLERHGFV